MKTCFGYIRVSTQKQGEGVSLEAQRDAIEAYAKREDLTVTHWFEEKETAAKRGRGIFNEVVKRLSKGEADGLILHKVDRGARNYADYAKIGDLADQGIAIHVAADPVDFTSRGGRLTADIQMVMATDFIRNLREETKKGINGRLKQGLFPWGAPPGYLNQGGGKPKIPCPKTSPLIKLLFEFYASRQYSYDSLLVEMHARGLRNTRGGNLTLCGLGNIIQNPFYIGLMRIKSSGKTYQGIHEPIISVATWKQAQKVREERSGPKSTRHGHLFQGIFRCGLCDKPMVPELQKGQVYYRCKQMGCPTKTIREDVLEDAILIELHRLQLKAKATRAADEAPEPQTIVSVGEQRASLSLQVSDEEARLERLEDLLIDEKVSAETYERKGSKMRLRLAELREKLRKLPDPAAIAVHLSKLAELRKSLVQLYENANRAEKRMIVENVWPNRTISRKELAFEPYDWVTRVNDAAALLGGAHERDTGRTSHNTEETDKLENLLNLLK